MPDDVYDADILMWSEQQAELLRRAAAGERVNGLDWPNLVEEIESVGRSELNGVESLLIQAFVHLMKIAAWPDAVAVMHWRQETIAFLLTAARRFTPAMCQRIDLADLYDDALARIEGITNDGVPARKLSQTCPFTLDELLIRRPDIATLSARLAAPQGGDHVG